MKFVTHRIVNPAGDAPDFNEFVENLLKQASEEAKPGLGIDTDDEPRGQQRGQVVNTEGEEDMTNDPQPPKQGGNARPDSGGTTDQKDHEQSDKEGSAEEPVKEAEATETETQETKEAECGKEMGESDDAGKVTEEHSDAGPGDDENPEPKVKINDDPNYQKGESTDPGKAKGDSKKQPGEPVAAQIKAKFEKVASMDRLQKLVLFASLSSNQSYPVEYAEAMAGIKVANMTNEEKEWFRDFWLTMYPPEYVENMVKDR